MRDVAAFDPTSWLPESNSQSHFGRLAWSLVLYIWISVSPKIYRLISIFLVKVGRYPSKVFFYPVNWSPSGNPADAMAEIGFHDANLWNFGLRDSEESQAALVLNESNDQEVQFGFPDAEESQAALALKEFSDQEVQAWLAFSRKGGFHLPSSNHRLAQKLVDAYLVLQCYDDLVVLQWVHEARSIGRSCVL